jgi:hypothetical protein
MEKDGETIYPVTSSLPPRSGIPTRRGPLIL